jgi:hypothetical protein
MSLFAASFEDAKMNMANWGYSRLLRNELLLVRVA